MYSLIMLLTFIIARVFLKNIDFENTSIVIIDLFLIVVFGGFIFLTLKQRKKGKGQTYNITISILMGLIGTSLLIGLTLIKYNPVIFYNFRWYITSLFFISFIILTIYSVIVKLKS